MKQGDLVKYIAEPGLEMSPHIGRTGVVITSPSSTKPRDTVVVLWDREAGLAKCVARQLEVVNEEE